MAARPVTNPLRYPGFMHAGVIACCALSLLLMHAKLQRAAQVGAYVGCPMPGTAQIPGMALPHSAKQGLAADQVQQVPKAGH